MEVSVTVHSSQFPQQLETELLESLRKRTLNHKFLYEGRRQARKWEDTHQKYSPSRNNAECQDLFEAVFDSVAALVNSPAAHIIGLGCGSGTKDISLLNKIRNRGKMLVYTACDTSVPLVLTARQKALEVLDGRHVHDLVADLLTAEDLERILITQTTGNSTRVLNFLGMIPNFEPGAILRRLSTFLRPNDILVFSANLAPGDDYRAGVEQVLPQYDNPETRDWLSGALSEAGIEPEDGQLEFGIEEDSDGNGLLRIVATFVFANERTIRMSGEEFRYLSGDRFQVFYSYRHTAKTARDWLNRENIIVVEEKVAANGEEAIFICRKILPEGGAGEPRAIPSVKK
jgi:L-histidine Nalpha-methyltransferase